MDRFVIAHDNKFKSRFDAWIMFVVLYSCLISLYNAAFEPLSVRYYPQMYFVDWVVEGFFYLDLILAFLHGYWDEDENISVDDFATIYNKYLNSWFAIDFFAVFPFQVFFSGGFALKLIRLMRLPRLFKLLSVQRFRKILIEMSSSKPGVESLDVIHRYIFGYKIIRLIFGLLLMAYISACVFYIASTLDSENVGKDCKMDQNCMGNNFIEINGLLEIDDTAKLITVSYFALTTLSTVGYGDYGPITQTEMIVTIVIQLAGVAVFSFAMGMLTSMIESTMSSRDHQADLDYW
jgi:hypothetical protein